MTTNNYISSSGLTLQTLAEIVTELETGFKTIYGVDINLDSNSPDGQMINLFAQAKIDILDLINSVYLSFSPSEAVGRVLDQRCAINGIVRNGATYTTVYIAMILNRTASLIGLDNGVATPFTVADPSGNPFYLITGSTGASGGSTGESSINYFLFRAAEAGSVEVSANTLTNIITPTLGVVSVNNPLGAVTSGADEETDVALRYRRSLSVANPSSGYLNGLIGALLAIPNVKYATVYENTSSSTDSYGVPAHSIWPLIDYVVGGTGATGATGAIGVTGAQTAIATAIYTHRNAGCGMTGSITETITQINGIDIDLQYSYVQYTPLYISLTVTSRDQVKHGIDTTFLINSILAGVEYGINEIADYSEISSLVKIADPLAVIISGGVGATGTTGANEPYLTPSDIFGTVDRRWIVQYGNIEITVVGATA
jgi:uncharacterized phage protein gp47/JayE